MSTRVSRPSTAPVLSELASVVLGTAGQIEVIEPASGRPMADVPKSSADDVLEAYRRARQAQPDWAETPASDRAAIAGRLADLLLARRDQGLDIIQRETGKARLHAFEELIEGVLQSEYYARHGAKLLRPAGRQGTFPLLTQAIELAHPRGVIGLISPWNYPLALSMDAIPALVAGNAVVHKADSQTPFSALWLRSLMVEAGLPPEVWQIVVGDPDDIGHPLVDHADYLAFTGSTAVGRKLSTRCGERLIGCSLELGGKNAMLVLADADVELAATAAIRACFGNAGQLCVGIERLLVDEQVYSAFVSRFLDKISRLRLGTPLDFTSDVGSLTSKKQLERIAQVVERARSEGATVLTGGKARPDLGPFFFEPTVLADLPEGSSVDEDESFGPVVSLRSVAGVDEALRLANDTPYGLNGSVFGRDVDRARSVAARLDCGTVSINEGYAAAYGSQAAPMGGRKMSGLGRRHGPTGLLRFTEAQTIASQRLLGFDPPAGMSARTYTRVISGALRVIKALRIR